MRYTSIRIYVYTSLRLHSRGGPRLSRSSSRSPQWLSSGARKNSSSRRYAFSPSERNKIKTRMQSIGNGNEVDPKPLRQQKYIVHYQNLQFYLSHGVRLVRIHRILQFRQSRWMEPYIRFNKEQRKWAKSSEEKNLFKLASNRCVINFSSNFLAKN